MIHSLKIIGQSLGNFSGITPADKKAFLLNLTILPQSHHKEGEPVERAVVIDFNLENNTFTIKKGLELTESNREKLFAFSAADFTPNGPKYSLSSNNIAVFINDSSTAKSAFRSLIKSEQTGANLKNYLSLYENEFYKDGFLNIEKMYLADREDFETYKRNLKNQGKDKIFDKLFVSWIKNKFELKNNENISIALIKFCDKTILEIDDNNISNEYIDIIYRAIAERTTKDKKGYETTKKAYCHICGKERKVLSSDIPIWKFYTPGTTYCQNTKVNSSAFSFGICEDCLKYVMVGQNQIESYLSGQIFGLKCYIIPQIKNTEETKYFVKGSFFDLICKLLNSKINPVNEMQEMHILLNKAKIKNFNFNLFFYFSPPASQEFRVRKLISNINLSGLTGKLQALTDMSDRYGLSALSTNDKFSHVLTLNFLRYVLFHSNYSHAKIAPVHYRNELLYFLEIFLNGGQYDYRLLARDFVNITHHKYHHSGIEPGIDAFKFILALQVFIELNMLKNYEYKQEANMLTEVPKTFEEFFKAHPGIYGDSPDRQGLFLLGVLINRIIYAQSGKSSTFMKKINLQGIEPRRVKALILQVKEYTEIYDIFEEGAIWACITEALQEIESSPLSSQEVVFYILTGMSYAKYLGITHGTQKENSTE